jgi:hypothetical protein
MLHYLKLLVSTQFEREKKKSHKHSNIAIPKFSHLKVTIDFKKFVMLQSSKKNLRRSLEGALMCFCT